MERGREREEREQKREEEGEEQGGKKAVTCTRARSWQLMQCDQMDEHDGETRGNAPLRAKIEEGGGETNSVFKYLNMAPRAVLHSANAVLYISVKKRTFLYRYSGGKQDCSGFICRGAAPGVAGTHPRIQIINQRRHWDPDIGQEELWTIPAEHTFKSGGFLNFWFYKKKKNLIENIKLAHWGPLYW